ncbi:hypothetical protein GWI33_018006 [Rhynchophorus ferrugineus]|uniref:SET domain-containing protein n=1 Tax=Rhynchophorus ferrugineus TaxID=354439 RepID=A0A834M8H6_RHYFE|nr:hypothetical protein GWI33_018006 [Rhynchophorus ferrugineus]
MVQPNITEFQKFCEKALARLEPNDLNEFKGTKDDLSRIKVLFDIAKSIPVSLPEENAKDFSAAELSKNEGNALFAKKEYETALKSYNKGIIRCPQETVKDRELLTILISNRSATNFELRKYRRVLDDIDYITEIGDYPTHLRYKLLLRKARCYDELQNRKLALEVYEEVIASLKHSNLDDKTRNAKLTDIEKWKTAGGHANKPVPKQELIPSFGDEKFLGGEEFLAANPKITVSQDNYQGRYAKAIDDIEVGTILVEETPYISVVDAVHSLSNCQNCLTSVELPIACPGCSDIVFCSTHCCRMSAKTFHAVECGWQKILFQNQASVNCLMALRIITHKPLEFFLDKRKKLKDYMKDSCKKNIVRKKLYRSDDYDNIFFLCRNESIRKKEELVHYTCIAIYLLNILKLRALILRHLQILQFNAHEISELQNYKDATKKSQNIFSANYESVTIGAGVYPTLAMFNHSCDPSVIRYNVKNKMIVRAIKPIKADDIIYENYGCLYMMDPRDIRQSKLMQNYYFECLCQPCTEMWPLYKEMNEKELRIPCKTERCPYTYSVKPDDDPFLECPYCGQTTSIFPNLKALMKLEEILPEAEDLLKMLHFENASKLFFEALKILFKYSRPPHPDIIKVQQRVSICLLHFGNKSFDYKPNM